MASQSDLEAVLHGIGKKHPWQWETHERGDSILVSVAELRPEEFDVRYSALVDEMGAYRINSGDRTPSEMLYTVLLSKGSTVSAAESCTGGLVCKMMTDIPGSSSVFSGGCVTYSNASKSELLGVSHDVIESKGAVSQEVVEAMCRSACERFSTEWGIAVSGIAGPAGGTIDKPVGTVWIGVANEKKRVWSRRFHFQGSRAHVRMKSAVASFVLAASCISKGDCLDIEQKW